MKFKDDVVASRFEDMHPKAQEIAIFMDEWSQKKYGVEITITSTVSTIAEDRALNRQSDTHRTGRAFDVRTRDLPQGLLAELIAETRKKYGKLGASNASGPNLIVYKPHGTFAHLHVQLNRKYIHNKETSNAKT